MPGWLHKSTVALQNPKQFPERLSFISLFIFVALATTAREGAIGNRDVSGD